METGEQRSLEEEEATLIAEIGKHLILNASHQHSRVRIASLNALQSIILWISLKDPSHQGHFMRLLRLLIFSVLELLELRCRITGLLFEMTHDRVASVRRTVYSVVGNWARESNQSALRDTFGDTVLADDRSHLAIPSELVSILFIGCNDAAEEIKLLAIQSVKDVRSTLVDTPSSEV